MAELKAGREFGKSTFLGDEGANFLAKPLVDQVTEMGWSHTCPVVDEVIKDYGPEWTLKRYAECNFAFGLIVESARDLNPELFDQLTASVTRSEGEKPDREFKPEFIPDDFYKQMSPLSTPWGYALPRVIIEEMGRGENNKDRTQKRILKSLNMIDKTVKTSKTPIELLVKLSEEAVRLDANPKAVLSHVLARGILVEEGCKAIFDEIKTRIDKSAPILKKTYGSMSSEERTKEGIINFSNESEKFRGFVRDLHHEDLVSIKPILEVWLKDRKTGQPLPDEVEEDLQLMADSIEHKNDRTYLVAENVDGKIIGVIGFKTPDSTMLTFAKTSNPAELVNAYVNPNERKGKGVGRALVAKLEEKAKAKGHTEIVLNSGPRYKDSGWGFYDKLRDYSRVGVAIGYYGEGGDAPVWTKEL